MKRIGLLLIFFVVLQGFCEDKITMDSLLDTRIKLNVKYTKMFMEEAQESTVKELKGIEEKVGDQWVAYLKYVRASKDKTLKVHVLKLEYLDELRGCYYDLEYSEDAVEAASLKIEILKWKSKLKNLDIIIKEDK